MVILTKGPTGNRYTFEQYLGLDETNVQIPDLGGRIELKATRRNSGSLITLLLLTWRVESKTKKVYKYGIIVKDNRMAYIVQFILSAHPSGLDWW